MLWYHWLELEGLIHSHMALDIYKLNGEVPETVITRDTDDISTVAINRWCDWIKFYDPVVNSFPEDKYYFGRYLGPEIDIGPALTEKYWRLTEKLSTDPPIGHSLHRIWTIDGNYRVINLIFKKYGNLPLCLEKCALFSLPPIYTNISY